MAGRIVLVGAGPGDPGLLTLKGQRWLQRADVIVYDYLANPRLLDHARADALRVLVGKHGGGGRVEQDVITALLIEHARQNKLVVRLKGGDPFVFGRGGEEVAAARAAGVSFEVVPGITAAVAAPAYAGIPLTHRDWASNVVFTTGYEYPNKPELAVHWNELARKGSTLVILMTQRQLRVNMDKLREAGRDPHTPAAVIEWGTRAAQRTAVGTIATIAEVADAAQIRPPALAVVGEVVRLRDQLSWFERKPLFGKHVVITRPRAQAGELAERLEDLGAETIALPTIEIGAPESYAALDAALRRPADFDWVLFTSANGVGAFFERLRTLDLDVRTWHAARIGAIGPQTADALRRYALRVDLIPDEYRAEGLVQELVARGVDGKRFLLPRAAGARDELPVQLRANGAHVETVTSYRSLLPAGSEEGRQRLLEGGRIDLLTFTSSSTVHNFMRMFREPLGEMARRADIACIGPVTAATAREYGLEVSIQPAHYTIAALVDAIVSHYQRSPAG